MKKYIIVAIMILTVVAIILGICTKTTVVCASMGTNNTTGFKQYDLQEAGVSIPIPTNYYVFTRGMPSDSPDLVALKLTASEVDTLFTQNDIYLYAISFDGAIDIIVKEQDCSDTDFNQFTDTMLDAYVESLVNVPGSEGISVDKYDVYRSRGITFIRFWKHSQQNSSSGLEYYTIHNNKSINISLSKQSIALSETDENLLLDIVNKTVVFNVTETVYGEPFSGIDSNDVTIGQDTSIQYRQYELSEIGVSIPMPIDYTVYTRGMSIDSPELIMYGMTPADVDSMLISMDAYLNAFSPDETIVITVEEYDSSISGFNTFTDEMIDAFASLVSNSAEQQGVTTDKYDKYSSGDITFVRFWRYSLGDSLGELEYYTVRNHRTLSISIFNRTGPIGEDEEKLISDIMNNAVFTANAVLSSNELSPGSDNPNKTQIHYTNTSYQIRFLIPNGWKEKALSQQNKGLISKFVPDSEDGTSIVLSYIDIWNDYFDDNARKALEISGYSRKDMDGSVFSISDAAQLLGIDPASLNKEQYGDQYYFLYKRDQTDTSLGFTITFHTTSCICIHNGFLYMFQLTVSGEAPTLFDDFLCLLSSVSFLDE